MRRSALCLGTLLALALGSSGAALAQVPQHLNHQGMLTNNAGVIVPDGPYVLEFEIHDTPAASGTPLFEQELTVNVVKGLYNVLLSDNAGGTLDQAFNGATRYLQIRIVSGGGYSNLVLSPRQQIASVPYALVAGRVVAEAEVTPDPATLACRDVDTAADPNFYKNFSANPAGTFTDAGVSCQVTAPAPGYAIQARGQVSAESDSSALMSLEVRLREDCGSGKVTVSSAIAMVHDHDANNGRDVIATPVSYLRTVATPGQACAYSLEAIAHGGTLNRNAGPSETGAATPPETFIEVVAIPLYR